MKTKSFADDAVPDVDADSSGDCCTLVVTVSTPTVRYGRLDSVLVIAFRLTDGKEAEERLRRSFCD